MPLDVNIDDTNTTLIQYQGSWTYIAGSTRQWEGGVHTTGQTGASATFNFRGYQVWVHGTIPAGSGTNIISVTIDGTTSSSISHTSNGSAVYDEVYFTSDLLRDTDHTLVVTNQGSITSGNSEFMLDRFEFQTDDDVPTFAPFPSTTSVSSPSASGSYVSSSYVSRSKSSASSTSSLSSSGTSLFSLSTSTNPTSSMPLSSSALVVTTDIPSTRSSSKTPWAGIIGAIVSCFVIVIGILLFVIWRKHRSPKGIDSSTTPLTPTPFPALDLPLPEDGVPSHSIPTILSEKIGVLQIQTSEHHQQDVQPETAQETAPEATPNVTSLPNSNVAGPSVSSSSSTGPYYIAGHHQAVDFREKYDFPPPSYQQSPTDS